ncbi:MAG: inositol monophosphatase [Lewinellaceae bacterium]|jgi:myo-inositol-1(or 4)-monophosphatase|nr:inositol monophosphatase [Lewinellaceae bacterium]
MNLEHFTRLAAQAVQETAAFIRAESGQVAPGQVEEKFLNGLVSYVDRTAEEMLVERLSRILPEASFITEEETVEQGDSELQWIIDPLDGTTNFLYNVPQYSVSVGLKSGDDLVIGIVHHVPADELFYAWKGGGAWCNGKAIQVSKRTEMRQALIATGFPYHNFSRADAWFGVMREFMREGRGVRRFGSAALDLAWVAAGRFDIFFEYGLNAWDIAAGAVLVREAGGTVADFSGENGFMEKQEMLACNAAVYEKALEVLRVNFVGGNI